MANQRGETTSIGHFFNRCTDAVNNLGEIREVWTHAKDVEFDDGETAQNKVGAIKGITSDYNTTDAGYAASMTSVSALNNSLGGLSFGTDGDGNYGYYGADGSLIPFSSCVFGFMTAAGEAKTIAAKPLVAYGMDMDTTNNKLTITQAGQYILCVGGHGTSFNNSLKVNGTKVIQGNATIVQSLNVGDVITGSASHASAWSAVVISIAKI